MTTPSATSYMAKRPDKYDICPSCGNPKRKHGNLCRKCKEAARPIIAQPDDPSIRHIPLTRGQYAIVDAHLYDWLNDLCRWQAQWHVQTRSYYAVGWVDRKSIPMHRLIVGFNSDNPRKVDHQNNEATLDNRGGNLRLATGGQNAKNRRRNRNNSTGFKGVYPNGGVFAAKIQVDGVAIYLGQRDTAEAAHRELYAPAALKYHGKFSRLS